MPVTQELNLRLATKGDAADIADLQTRSWQTTYRGQFPDAYLDEELPEELAQTWKDGFDDCVGKLTILATVGEHLAGFAHSVIDDDGTWGTLLGNLHVDPDMKRMGIGHVLVTDTATRLLTNASSARMYLWVLEANQAARRFYDALGGTVVERTVDEVHHGITHHVLRYAWPDIGVLTR